MNLIGPLIDWLIDWALWTVVNEGWIWLVHWLIDWLIDWSIISIDSSVPCTLTATACQFRCFCWAESRGFPGGPSGRALCPRWTAASHRNPDRGRCALASTAPAAVSVEEAAVVRVVRRPYLPSASGAELECPAEVSAVPSPSCCRTPRNRVSVRACTFARWPRTRCRAAPTVQRWRCLEKNKKDKSTHASHLK